MQRYRVYLALIALTYSLLATLYAVLIPPWESPDEPAHYQYVVQLAERKRPPQDSLVRQKDRFCRDYPYISSNYEWYHPPLGYVPLAIVYQIVESLSPSILPDKIPQLNLLFCEDPFRYPALFLHEDLKPLLIWKDKWGLLILRLSASLWGLVIIYAVYQTSHLLKMGNFAIVTAAWVAFLPQFIFISATIRNDTVANVIGALLFLLIARVQMSKPDRLSGLLMGLLSGAGILTKLNLLYLLPLTILALILPQWKTWQKWTGPVFLVAASYGAVVILYYLLYGEARAALSYTMLQMQIKPQAFSWSYWKPFLPMLTDLFFARFGWANVTLPNGWIRFACGIWSIGAGLTLLQSMRLFHKKQEMATVHLLALFAFSLAAALAGVIRYNLAQFQPQGRFLFPVLLPWAIWGMWGVHQSLSGQRIREVVGVGLIGFMLLFNLRALVVLWTTYY